MECQAGVVFQESPASFASMTHKGLANGTLKSTGEGLELHVLSVMLTVSPTPHT